MRKVVLLIISILIFNNLFAQQLNYPLSNPYINKLDKALYAPESIFHTAVKPWLQPEVNKIVRIDSLEDEFVIRNKYSKKFYKWAWDKVFNQHFIDIEKEGFRITADPVFNFEIGKDVQKDDGNKYCNTRGFLVEGSLGKDFSFSTTFYENQATFVDYIDNTIRKGWVVPGQGGVKPFGEKGFDYAWASGYISYTPSKYFNIQFGHGKNFIGDGYRSLLLSDNTFNYPFLKITTNVWRLKYVNLYAEFQDLKSSHTYELGFRKKYGTFHYLSYAVTKRLNIGIFESVIWQAQDSSGFRGFDINYLNPVIFYRPVEFSLGSPDNALLGLNISYKLAKNYVLYAQLMLDEFKIKEVLAGNGWWGNKQAVQLGVKAFDLLNVKNLYVQTEYNYVRPYMYSHSTSLQNYGHYNQSLTHPTGANFWESVSIIKYNYKRLFAEFKLNYILYGADSANINYGKDIFQSYNNHPKDYDNFVGQGIKTTVIYNDLRVSYLINPRTNLNISLGISNRMESSSIADINTSYIYFGIRTSLHNFYYDF